MTFLKKTGAFCLAAFLGYKYITADSPGYCAAQDRYISDAEFIRTTEALFAWGIEDRLQDRLRWATENPDGPPLTQLSGFANSSYERHQRWVAEFENNRNRPGFIKVVRDETHTIFRWLFGYQQIQIVMNANSGDGQSPYTYDVCGKLLQSGLFSPSAVTTTNYLEILNKYSHDK